MIKLRENFWLWMEKKGYGECQIGDGEINRYWIYEVSNCAVKLEDIPKQKYVDHMKNILMKSIG